MFVLLDFGFEILRRLSLYAFISRKYILQKYLAETVIQMVGHLRLATFHFVFHVMLQNRSSNW